MGGLRSDQTKAEFVKNHSHSEPKANIRPISNQLKASSETELWPQTACYCHQSKHLQPWLVAVPTAAR